MFVLMCFFIFSSMRICACGSMASRALYFSDYKKFKFTGQSQDYSKTDVNAHDLLGNNSQTAFGCCF